jgi:hypothetical protein
MSTLYLKTKGFVERPMFPADQTDHPEGSLSRIIREKLLKYRKMKFTWRRCRVEA